MTVRCRAVGRGGLRGRQSGERGASRGGTEGQGEGQTEGQEKGPASKEEPKLAMPSPALVTGAEVQADTYLPRDS